jgi:hypothetical protein
LAGYADQKRIGLIQIGIDQVLEDGDVEIIAIHPLKSIVFILLLIAGGGMVGKGITHIPKAVPI